MLNSNGVKVFHSKSRTAIWALPPPFIPSTLAPTSGSPDKFAPKKPATCVFIFSQLPPVSPKARTLFFDYQYYHCRLKLVVVFALNLPSRLQYLYQDNDFD